MKDIIENPEQLTTENTIAVQTEWDDPTPFLPIQNPDIPYPLHALPTLLQKTVTEYQQYGQQPIALVRHPINSVPLLYVSKAQEPGGRRAME